MSKALPLVIAVVLGTGALVPVYLASQNPENFLTSSHNTFNSKNATAMQKISYFFGYRVASEMAPPELDVEAFNAGARAGNKHETMPYTDEEIEAAYSELVAQQQKNNTSDPYYNTTPSVSNTVTDSENIQFLQENAKKPDVKTTATGLQYTVDKKGTGKQPTTDSMVKVNYEGKLIDGTVFDSSFERNEPIEFALNQVIPGWTEGLQLMKEGAEYTFFIPANLAYGSQGKDSIPPNSTLIFKVQLLEVK